MDNNAIEAPEQPPPQMLFVRGAAWQEVVGCEDERRPRMKEPAVELGDGAPLHVDNVCAGGGEPREAERMLEDPERDAGKLWPDPCGQRVEAFAEPVAGRVRPGAEAKPRGEELDVRTRSGQGGGKLVVVRRRERGGIGEQDAHGAKTRGATRAECGA